MKSLITLSLLSLISVSTFAQTPPAAQIENVFVSGTGCSMATAAVSLSPDLQELSILFDNYSIQATAAMVNPRNLMAEKSCKVSFDVVIPSGYTFAFKGVDYRGFADIPHGATGYQRFLFKHPASQIVSLRDASFGGPYSDLYDFQALIKPQRALYTPCGLSRIRLDMTSVIGVQYHQRGVYPAAQINLDSQDLSMSQDFHMDWQRCAMPAPRPIVPGPSRPGPVVPGPSGRPPRI